jgi:hypothetical protein
MEDPEPNLAGEHSSPPFAPVSVRARHDGWTALKQITYIQVLADTGCVTEAAKAVGMSVASAYALRRRTDAHSFREAWDVALDYGIGRLADAALGRAIHGVPQPIFHNGEQVGERRKYDEKLTMFLLRYRRPDRYGAWLDGQKAGLAHPDAPARMLHHAIANIAEDAQADAAGVERPDRAPLQPMLFAEDFTAVIAAHEREQKAKRHAEERAYMQTLLSGEWTDPDEEA